MTCEHCGAALPAFALFCGECGRSVAASPLVAPVVAPVQPPTVPLVPTEPAEMSRPEPEPAEVSQTEPEPEAEQTPDAEPELEAEPVLPPSGVDVPSVALAPAPPSMPIPAAPACASCGARAEPDDRFCGDCGTPLEGATRIIEPLAPHVPVAAPVLPEPVAPPVVPEPIAPPVVPAPPAASPVLADESTRIVPRGTGGARFVLQFSTGESYTVLGSGLAGRNPRPEPGEYVDHLVTVVDPGRSVSKTHFEFGQEGGVFWFSDRHSGNGSVIREPGAPARPCIPGHRYPIVRGTRIDIGEQFVVVS